MQLISKIYTGMYVKQVRCRMSDIPEWLALNLVSWFSSLREITQTTSLGHSSAHHI